MTFRLACGDVLPGCPAHFESADRGGLLRQVADHARDTHQIDPVTPEMLAGVEGVIVEFDPKQDEGRPRRARSRRD